jgi:hypothetical protein
LKDTLVIRDGISNHTTFTDIRRQRFFAINIFAGIRRRSGYE